MKDKNTQSKNKGGIFGGEFLKHLLAFFVCFSLVFSVLAPLSASAQIITSDTNLLQYLGLRDKQTDAKEKWYEILWKNGANMLQNVYRKALERLAYDSAVYIGSGREGQKPMWEEDGWDVYLNKVGDNAFGDLIEEFSGEDGFLKFNICEPNFDVKFMIGMGLVNQKKPKEPSCTFTEFRKNWTTEWERIQNLGHTEYMKMLQNSFKPTSNHLGMALKVQTDVMEDVKSKVEAKTDDRKEAGGWLDVENIAGQRVANPGYAGQMLNKTLDIVYAGSQTWVGEPIADAANVFLNQLFITAIQTQLKKLGGKSNNNSFSAEEDYSKLFNPNDDAGVRGKTEIENDNKKISKGFSKMVIPNYEKAYQLAACSDPNNAQPDECVIDEGFASAITEQKTVAQAIEDGDLNGGGTFGFAEDGRAPLDGYKGNYPYRSMKILRRERIIPVGWEVAAERIFDGTGSGRMMTLNEMVACFDSGDDFTGYGEEAGESWCHGLVDPYWVLKVPEHYCEKEGYSPIVDAIVSDNGDYAIMRNSGYCADEKSCIKKDANGNCVYYGYCTEERREWDFDTESCEPRSNSCQTYTNEDGLSISYLKNTIEYAACNYGNAGCLDYCVDYDYTNDEFCADPGDEIIYLDNGSDECGEDGEGCQKLVRTKPDLGVNLFFNSSFEDDNGIDADNDVDRICDGNGFLGDCYISFNNSEDGLWSNSADLFDVSSYPLQNKRFSLSFYARDCGTGGEFEIRSNNPIDDFATSSLRTGGSWQRNTLSHIFSGGDDINISLRGVAAGCVIDAIQLERGSLHDYSDYAVSGIVYEKILPEYLEDVCYIAPGVDYRYQDAHPSECDDYARRCVESELGCEMYTSADDGMETPAKVIDADYCAAECAGYDDYLQSETVFESQKPAYFVPDRAQQCNAASVGCDQFTNLDAVRNGGEEIEYYSYLRQCVVTSDVSPNTDCAEYYAWTGDGSTAMGIMKFTLRMDVDDIDGDGNITEPAATEDDSAVCNEAIYNLPATDPGYNSDCRAFYDTSGNISYRLYEKTITCSENCYAYRKTENNVVKDSFGANITNTECNTLLAGYPGQVNYNTTTGECVFCKNGGVWNNTYEACVYNAIPEQGRSCSSSENKCREYSGSAGNNTRIVLNSDFEGSEQGWMGVGETNVVLTSDSLRSGEEALEISGGAYTATTTVFGLREGRSYVVRFLAKSNGTATEISRISITNSLSSSDFAIVGVSGALSGDWRIYEFDLARIDYEVGILDSFLIEADGAFSIDDVRLIEITDRYYLIKDSWDTPDSCVHDIFGNPVGQLYNVGCSEYIDRDDTVHYLKSFDQLCQDSAVGCELLVDTHNYSNYDFGIWNDDNSNDICEAGEVDCKYVPEDNLIYAVYDRKKSCVDEEKGCQMLGQPFHYKDEVVYEKIYKVNDPDTYELATGEDSSMCSFEEFGCDGWSFDGGVDFFRSPGGQVCEWRRKQDPTDPEPWNWLSVAVDRCDDDSDGDVIDTDHFCLSSANCGLVLGYDSCDSNSDCGSNNTCVDGKCRYSCIEDDADYECGTDSSILGSSPAITQIAGGDIKTFGYGGEGLLVTQPSINGYGVWAGICSNNSSGCTEFIDPVSKHNPNLVRNGNFSNSAEGWVGNDFGVILEPNSLYVLSVNDALGARVWSDGNNISIMDNDNEMLPYGNNTGDIVSPALGDNFRSIMFYTQPMDPSISGMATVTITNMAVDNNTYHDFGPGERIVSLRKVIVDYQLAQGVDRTECNGEVNSDNGCVLFNERSVTGDTYQTLSYDSQNTENGPRQSAENCDPAVPGSCNANALIKVTPDRECEEWLASQNCTINPLTGGTVCKDVVNCVEMDFVNESCMSTRENNIPHYFDVDTDQDATGYVKIGMNHFGNMEEIGISAVVPNGDFEEFDDRNSPLSWYFDDDTDHAHAYVINDPIDTKGQGITYPAHDRSYLKLTSSEILRSPSIGVVPGATYYISYMVNTSHLSGSVGLASSTLSISGAFTNEVFEVEQGSADWVEKTEEFIVGGTDSSIQISLGATSTLYQPQGSVYFDNIRIEPVLDTGIGYIPKSCRLFPESDSMTCQSTSRIVGTGQGEAGYCLEYDENPGSKHACNMWYPVDRIRADDIIESGTGYDGKAPVYYCSEMDANFNYVERRIPFQAEARTIDTDVPSVALGAVIGALTSGWVGFVAGGPMADYFNDHDTGAYDDYTSANAEIICGSDRYYTHVAVTRTDHNLGLTYDYHLTSVCVPRIDLFDRVVDFGAPTLVPIFHGGDWPAPNAGWYIYDGNLVNNTGNLGNEEVLDREYGNPVDGTGDNNPTSVESVMIYDHSILDASYHHMYGMNHPDFVPADDHSGVGALVEPRDYYLSCNRFHQVVTESGENRAWADRTKTNSEYVTELGYHYLYEDDTTLAPFGSAVQPSIEENDRNRNEANWNGNPRGEDERLNMRIPFQTDNLDVYAGFPYGCSGIACNMIGRCEHDRDLVCVDPGELIAGGGWNQGTKFGDSPTIYYNNLMCPQVSGGAVRQACIPIPNLGNGGVINGVTQISQLFTESYRDVEWDFASSTYRVYVPGPVSPMIDVIGPPISEHCTDDERPTTPPDDFCWVQPEILNVHLFRGNDEIEIDTVTGEVEIEDEGDYTLTFNTRVDGEQLPIKEIYLEWEDGTVSNLPFEQGNINHRPHSENPHTFTHHYNFAGDYRIQIRIVDNWEHDAIYP